MHDDMWALLGPYLVLFKVVGNRLMFTYLVYSL